MRPRTPPRARGGLRKRRRRASSGRWRATKSRCKITARRPPHPHSQAREPRAGGGRSATTSGCGGSGSAAPAQRRRPSDGAARARAPTTARPSGRTGGPAREACTLSSLPTASCGSSVADASPAYEPEPPAMIGTMGAHGGGGSFGGGSGFGGGGGGGAMADLLGLDELLSSGPSTEWTGRTQFGGREPRGIEPVPFGERRPFGTAAGPFDAPNGAGRRRPRSRRLPPSLPPRASRRRPFDTPAADFGGSRPPQVATAGLHAVGSAKPISPNLLGSAVASSIASPVLTPPDRPPIPTDPNSSSKPTQGQRRSPSRVQVLAASPTLQLLIKYDCKARTLVSAQGFHLARLARSSPLRSVGVPRFEVVDARSWRRPRARRHRDRSTLRPCTRTAPAPAPAPPRPRPRPRLRRPRFPHPHPRPISPSSSSSSPLALALPSPRRAQFRIAPRRRPLAAALPSRSPTARCAMLAAPAIDGFGHGVQVVEGVAAAACGAGGFGAGVDGACCSLRRRWSSTRTSTGGAGAPGFSRYTTTTRRRTTRS